VFVHLPYSYCHQLELEEDRGKHLQWSDNVTDTVSDKSHTHCDCSLRCSGSVLGWKTHGDGERTDEGGKKEVTECSYSDLRDRDGGEQDETKGSGESIEHSGIQPKVFLLGCEETSGDNVESESSTLGNTELHYQLES
jgi:hypothetical protein